MTEDSPIVELIAQDLLATVNGVTEANGYLQTLTAVRPKRVNAEADITGDLCVLIEQDDPEQVGVNGNVQEWRQTFAVQAFVIDSDAATVAIDTRINFVLADLLKAIMADHTRGGYAIRQEIGDIDRFIYAGYSGVAVSLEVHYRTTYGDPYTQQ